MSETKLKTQSLNFLNHIMEVGEQMLISGAEVHEVEECIKRMCYSLGAIRVDVFIITSSMVVTIHTDSGETYTQTRRITTANTNFEKLHRLNELSKEFCEYSLSDKEMQQKLYNATNCKKFSVILEFICYSVIAAAFTIFFGGSIIEAVISFFVGACVRSCILLCDKIISNRIFPKFVSSAIVTLLAFLTVKIGWIDRVDTVIIGNIMTLIPGIGLTNALRDLFVGDSITGILRFIEAILTATAIAAGYFPIAFLGGITL